MGRIFESAVEEKIDFFLKTALGEEILDLGLSFGEKIR